MAQSDIDELLKEYKGEWLTAKNIAFLLKSNVTPVSRCLKKMRMYEEVRYTLKKSSSNREVRFYSYKEVENGR